MDFRHGRPLTIEPDEDRGAECAGVVAANRPPRRIAIVDDDASIREALKSLMRSVRFNVEAFASAEEFLASERFDDTACLILDVYLPGMSGFELQNHLNDERPRHPDHLYHRPCG